MARSTSEVYFKSGKKFVRPLISAKAYNNIVDMADLPKSIARGLSPFVDKVLGHPSMIYIDARPEWAQSDAHYKGRSNANTWTYNSNGPRITRNLYLLPETLRNLTYVALEHNMIPHQISESTLVGLVLEAIGLENLIPAPSEYQTLYKEYQNGRSKYKRR